MVYGHLTQEERYQIYACRKAGLSIRRVAQSLGRSPSTVSRELKRNVSARGYRPRRAEELARERSRRARRHLRIGARQWTEVVRLLERRWSPEQIAGRASKEGTLAISFSWIYRYVAADRAAGGEVWRTLRRANRRRRRYHHRPPRRPTIRFRTGIEHRPHGVESRNQLGHWEADTIVSAGRHGAALTLVERTSRYLRLGWLPSTDARTTADIARNRLHRFSARVLSITFDNGSEFARHPRIARALSTETYFAEPYKPWQRATNENTNGLVRQYLPRTTRLDELAQADLDKVEKALNDRPRKCLGFLTPAEVFHDTRQTLTVALRSSI